MGRPRRQQHPAAGVAAGEEPINLVEQTVGVAAQWAQQESFIEVRNDAPAGCQGELWTTRHLAVEAFRDALADVRLVVEELAQQVVADGCIHQPPGFGRSLDGRLVVHLGHRRTSSRRRGAQPHVARTPDRRTVVAESPTDRTRRLDIARRQRLDRHHRRLASGHTAHARRRRRLARILAVGMHIGHRPPRWKVRRSQPREPTRKRRLRRRPSHTEPRRAPFSCAPRTACPCRRHPAVVVRHVHLRRAPRALPGDCTPAAGGADHQPTPLRHGCRQPDSQWDERY